MLCLSTLSHLVYMLCLSTLFHPVSSGVAVGSCPSLRWFFFSIFFFCIFDFLFYLFFL